MKIGVTGSDHICDRIQKTLEKRMPDLEVVYRRSNDYRYGLEAAAQFQKGKVSGIIFTGPTNYHYALKRLEPNVPWTFLPHNQASILKALAESAVRYSCVPDVISIDMYEEQLVQGTLEEIGISMAASLWHTALLPIRAIFRMPSRIFTVTTIFTTGQKSALPTWKNV